MDKSRSGKTEENKVIKVRIHKGKSKQELVAPLFSQKEVRRFVTEFVSSWTRGDIIIRFPTAAELSKKTPLSIAFPTDPSVSQELKIKQHFIDLLLVCAGITEASAQEKEEAVSEAFRMLLMFRSANRIEGKIISNSLEKRVANLEEKMQATGKLVEQITSLLLKEKKAESMKARPNKG